MAAVKRPNAKTRMEGTSRPICSAALKNVGQAAMENLVAERGENGPFADIQDFANRLDSKTINKRQLENLIRAGALLTPWTRIGGSSTTG